jgi:hypothetical protein
MSVQLGNVADSFIYRDDDKPYYRRGNKQLLAINIAAIVLFLLTKLCKLEQKLPSVEWINKPMHGNVSPP